VALGAALARNEIAALLNGEGAECTLNGLYAGAGTQHIDNYTTLDHAQPHSTSHELYKGVLDGHSEGVFHGRIIVRPEAQKTDAIQRNRNLLLSRNAVINTKPQLEIYADDVKCTHGATIGQVDQDAVFYLRSRGIPNQEARNLLTYAFTADIIERFKVEAIRSRLGDELFARLSGR
jgi:Fe-S cluster assembly protein SufD